jgi:hypothetical protein
VGRRIRGGLQSATSAVPLAGMHERSFEYVLVPAHVRTPETTGLIEMGAGSLQQLPALPEESLPAVAPDPASIGIDRVAFGLLIDPRLWLIGVR